MGSTLCSPPNNKNTLVNSTLRLRPLLRLMLLPRWRLLRTSTLNGRSVTHAVHAMYQNAENSRFADNQCVIHVKPAQNHAQGHAHVHAQGHAHAHAHHAHAHSPRFITDQSHPAVHHDQHAVHVVTRHRR